MDLSVCDGIAGYTTDIAHTFVTSNNCDPDFCRMKLLDGIRKFKSRDLWQAWMVDHGPRTH